MSTPSTPARSPLVAVVLSLAATGLGQIYCGRIVRGLVMFLGSLLFAPVIAGAALVPPATVVLVGLILALTVLGSMSLRSWTPSALPAAAVISSSQWTTTIRWSMPVRPGD